MKKDTLINKIINNRDTVLKRTTFRIGLANYLAFYGYGWYKMGITNNPERREKELNIYHFSEVKIIATIKVEGEGVFTAEKELIKVFKDSGAKTKGEFVYIPSVAPEVVAKKYQEIMINTVKKLRKNTFNSMRKTNNVLRKNGYDTIKADVSLTIGK
jgi:hypothetical protein|tara:strand:- start:129 stop:599 length:471 start_codon:yes stop_codon:yes gene_type:complete